MRPDVNEVFNFNIVLRTTVSHIPPTLRAFEPNINLQKIDMLAKFNGRPEVPDKPRT